MVTLVKEQLREGNLVVRTCGDDAGCQNTVKCFRREEYKISSKRQQKATWEGERKNSKKREVNWEQARVKQ